MDAASGKEQVLVSAPQLKAALGIRPDANAFDSNDNPDPLGGFQSYAWAPDGHHLLLASGDALSWFDLDARSSRSLITAKEDTGKEASDKEAISNPAISPDGRSVSFIREHTIWVVDVASGSARALTHEGTSDLRVGEPDWVYQNELGLPTAYWWAPDSSAIAWLETDDLAVDKYTLRSASGEERSIAYPKPGASIPAIHLFVQAIDGGKPLQIDLGSDLNVYIPRVQWLPDSKRLAVERLSRNQKILELLLADTASGSSNVILTEKDDYWINLGDELHFLKGSPRFIWSSERTSGYRHLFLYDLSGHQLAQLTQGDWKVNSLVSVDEKAGAVYFTATEASPLERQLFRARLNGSGLTRLTHQKGTHDVQASPSGALFLDAWSNRSTPPQLDLLHTDGSRIASMTGKQPDDLAQGQLPLPEFLTVKTHMGAELNASIIKPPDFDPARQYPVLIYIAGGPGEQIVRDAWGGDIQLWFAMMAQKGYVVFALDNRGADEGGHLFEEPLHLRLSGVEMADQRDGVLYLRTLPWVDKTRIGICGWGYGGFLALHGMLDRPVLFKAGFAGSPVTDWHLYDAVFAERYLEDPTRNQDGWLASSPTENAKYLKTPLLIAQATMDEKVHVENSLMLLDEFLDQGKYPDVLLFPDRRDLFEDRGARQILFQRLTDFFAKNL
jgi:dipeptidyl-peptidase 4